MQLLTPQEMAYVLEIHPNTLNALTTIGSIPHTYIQPSNQVRFDPFSVIEWLHTAPPMKSITSKEYLDDLRKQCKTLTTNLKELNKQLSPKRTPKGYTLSKVPSKRYGFLYYVRYIRDGKTIPSRWCTHTNNLKIAEQFAIENKELILSTYDNKHGENHIFKVIETFYEEDSKYLKDVIELGRDIGKKTRIGYLNHIKTKFIPYFKRNSIKDYSSITPKEIRKYQVELLRNGTKPQTINRCLGGISKMLDYLVGEGIIKSNVIKDIGRLNESRTVKTYGCYRTEEVFNIFNQAWDDELSFLLNLVIYSTGLRNSEIERITLQDIIKIGDFNYINVKESKTGNGIRLVPLHPFVHNKLVIYACKLSKQNDEPLFFSQNQRADRYYEKAYKLLGTKLGYDENYLRINSIVFYSGRHYWKTLMSENALGDIEEIFMGHKASADVKKRYDHHDRKGQKFFLEKTAQVFSILNETLFKGLYR